MKNIWVLELSRKFDMRASFERLRQHPHEHSAIISFSHTKYSNHRSYMGKAAHFTTMVPGIPQNPGPLEKTYTSTQKNYVEKSELNLPRDQKSKCFGLQWSRNRFIDSKRTWIKLWWPRYQCTIETNRQYLLKGMSWYLQFMLMDSVTESLTELEKWLHSHT